MDNIISEFKKSSANETQKDSVRCSCVCKIHRLANIPCATGSFPSGARSVPREMIPRGAFMGTAYAR